jgi:para-nitrobenzyl esterase
VKDNDKTIVQTKYGKIQGGYEDRLYVFRGIPYAKPPVGKRRWLPPKQVEPWNGIRPAMKFGAIAPQPKIESVLPGRERVDEPQDEDCLYLNVWTPGIDGLHRPVMVWIHGGAFSMGSGSNPECPGSTLPKRGNVVYVSMNYRLGPLGFLRLKEITGGKVPSTGNEGLLDQIAALQWVHDNIAAFGGDPDNVIIFGESAGAMSIGCLLAISKARGLFKKAILQSGGNTVRTLRQTTQTAEKFLEVLKLSPQEADIIQALPVERLLSTQQHLNPISVRAIMSAAAMQPVVDGDILPTQPIDAVANGSADGVAVLAGSNLEEGKLFPIMDPALAKIDETGLEKRLARFFPADKVPGLIEAYRDALTGRSVMVRAIDIQQAIQGDQLFRIPVVRIVEAQYHRNQVAFNYLFTWKSAVPVLGACHGLDVGFVFGNLVKEFHGTGAAAERLAGNIQDAWIAFARTGKPGCKSLGEWPQYGSRRMTMMLGESSHVEEAPYEAERRAWDNISNESLGG